MKTLYMCINCQAYYEAEIQVPDDMTLDEAIEYAQEHLDEIPLGDLEYVPYSDELDVGNCELYEED